MDGNEALKNRIAVYVARVPKDAPIGEISHPIRRAEAETLSNEAVKREKYFVWRLLEEAVRREFGIDVGGMELTRNENGKWVSPICQLSLSHSGGGVALALSGAENPVGVDIELIGGREMVEKMAARFLTPDELSEYKSAKGDSSDAFLILWTKKEAVFKMQNLPVFAPSAFSYLDAACFIGCERVSLGEEKYILSYASAMPADAEFITIELG